MTYVGWTSRFLESGSLIKFKEYFVHFWITYTKLQDYSFCNIILKRKISIQNFVTYHTNNINTKVWIDLQNDLMNPLKIWHRFRNIDWKNEQGIYLVYFNSVRIKSRAKDRYSMYILYIDVAYLHFTATEYTILEQSYNTKTCIQGSVFVMLMLRAVILWDILLYNSKTKGQPL